MKIIEWVTAFQALVECDNCGVPFLRSKTKISELNFCEVECKPVNKLTIQSVPQVELIKKIKPEVIRTKVYPVNIRTKAQRLCYEACIELFGRRQIKSGEVVNGWCVDMYVKKLDTYVQVDSVYWHGLDRSIEKILEFKNPRDKTIYETYLRDQEQNDWFKTNSKKLIRFTDKEVLAWQKEKKLVQEINSQMKMISVQI